MSFAFEIKFFFTESSDHAQISEGPEDNALVVSPSWTGVSACRIKAVVDEMMLVDHPRFVEPIPRPLGPIQILRLPVSGIDQGQEKNPELIGDRVFVGSFCSPTTRRRRMFCPNI